MRFRALLLATLLGSAAGAQAKPRLLPLLNAGVWGGWSSYSGRATRFRGSSEVEFMPVVELTPRHALLPSLRAAYSGHESAFRLLDGKTLFQEELSDRFELSWLYRFRPDWKWVNGGGGSWSYLKETRDESWGHGLYDHRSLFLNTALERRLRGRIPGRLRGGAELSHNTYPNFQSLAGDAGYSLAGVRTLDTHATLWFVNGENALSERFSLQYSVNVRQDRFPDQKVVLETSVHSNEDRRDTTLSGRIGGQYIPPAWESRRAPGRVVLRLSLGVQQRRSNQNEVDVANPAQPVHFLPDFFDYREYSLGPSVEFRLAPSHLSLRLSDDWTCRRYDRRPAQNADGSYRDKTLVTLQNILSLQLSVPVGDGLRASLRAETARADANTDFSGYYNYRYRTRSLLLGFDYGF